MYTLQSQLAGQPVISLQTGQIVAWAEAPLLDIATLEIICFTCQPVRQSDAQLIMAGDVRQYATDCIIIDDEDELVDPKDIVRLKDDQSHQYSPIGKLVVADTGRRIGIVEDYSINLETSRVQRLYVRHSLWRALFTPNAIIDRTQIIDITPDHITVRDSTVTDTVLSPDSVPEINP